MHHKTGCGLQVLPPSLDTLRKSMRKETTLKQHEQCSKTLLLNHMAVLHGFSINPIGIITIIHNPWTPTFQKWGTPKSTFLVAFPIINHPSWDTPIVGNHHVAFLRILQWIHCFGVKVYGCHLSCEELVRPALPKRDLEVECGWVFFRNLGIS